MPRLNADRLAGIANVSDMESQNGVTGVTWRAERPFLGLSSWQHLIDSAASRKTRSLLRMEGTSGRSVVTSMIFKTLFAHWRVARGKGKTNCTVAKFLLSVRLASIFFFSLHFQITSIFLQKFCDAEFGHVWGKEAMSTSPPTHTHTTAACFSRFDVKPQDARDGFSQGTGTPPCSLSLSFLIPRSLGPFREEFPGWRPTGRWQPFQQNITFLLEGFSEEAFCVPEGRLRGQGLVTLAQGDRRGCS